MPGSVLGDIVISILRRGIWGSERLSSLPEVIHLIRGEWMNGPGARLQSRVWAQLPLGCRVTAHAAIASGLASGRPRGRGAAGNAELRLARPRCIFLLLSSKAALGFTNVGGHSCRAR